MPVSALSNYIAINVHFSKLTKISFCLSFFTFPLHVLFLLKLLIFPLTIYRLFFFYVFFLSPFAYFLSSIFIFILPAIARFPSLLYYFLYVIYHNLFIFITYVYEDNIMGYICLCVHILHFFMPRGYILN